MKRARVRSAQNSECTQTMQRRERDSNTLLRVVKPSALLLGHGHPSRKTVERRFGQSEKLGFPTGLQYVSEHQHLLDGLGSPGPFDSAHLLYVTMNGGFPAERAQTSAVRFRRKPHTLTRMDV